MRKWLPLVAIALGAFMLLVDVTIVTVALPDMALDLDTSFTSLQWVIDIYALVLAGLLLGAGAIGDRVGHRSLYVGGMIVFAASSLAAGLSPGGAELIVARGLQGAGAAAMFAMNAALINDIYQGRDRGVAFGVWGAVNGAATAMGPVIGGLLTQGLSWRWIFIVNLPICIVAVTMALRALPADRGRSTAPIDVLGIAAFTIAAVLLTYALTRAPEVGWSATSTVVLLVLSGVALGAFLVIEARSRFPALDLGLLRRPAFAGVLLAGFTMTAASFGFVIYVSLWLQSVREMTPIATGLSFLPLSIAALCASLAVGRVLHRAPPRLPIAGGLALIALGALLQAHLDATSTWRALIPGMLVVGAGVGLVSPAVASAMLSSVPPERGGMASGALNTARQMGFALGITILGVICQSRVADLLREQGVDDAGHVAREVVAGQRYAVLAEAPAKTRAAIDDAIHAAFASGLNRAMMVSCVAGAIGAIVVAYLLRSTAEPADDTAVETVGGQAPA